MFKKNFKLLDWHSKEKTLRTLFYFLLCFLTFLVLYESTKIGVSAQTCSNIKFPLTLGLSSGETEIISID